METCDLCDRVLHSGKCRYGFFPDDPMNVRLDVPDPGPPAPLPNYYGLQVCRECLATRLVDQAIKMISPELSQQFLARLDPVRYRLYEGRDNGRVVERVCVRTSTYGDEECPEKASAG